MRKVITVFIVLTFCIIVGIWSPWLNWDINPVRLLGIEPPEKFSSLQVLSSHGQIDVYIDNEKVGTANEGLNPYIKDKVSPGKHLITLKKVSDIPGAYWTFSKVLEFVDGIQLVISFDLGPSELFSQGHIIYVKPKADAKKDTNLILTVNSESANVLIDTLSATEITANKLLQPIDLSRKHNIIIAKKGYETLNFNILPDNQKERDLFKDYDIYVEVYLALSALEVE